MRILRYYIDSIIGATLENSDDMIYGLYFRLPLGGSLAVLPVPWEGQTSRIFSNNGMCSGHVWRALFNI